MNPVPPPAGKYAGYWTIKKLRRALRSRLNRWLARSAGAPPACVPLEPAAIHRVIVCRRNNRLGNMLFLTPLLHSLAATLPQAEIDLLIGSTDYRSLFKGMPGVRRVWVMPGGGWLWPLRMLALLFRLRAQAYDLSIEPTLNSFSSRLSAHLCSARWRLGFHTPNQWLSLTHAVVPDPSFRHEAHIPQQLVQAGFSRPAPAYPRLWLQLSEAERRAGAARLAALLGPGHGPVVGFFTEATGRKRLPPEWWRDWLIELRRESPSLRLLQILPPGASEPLLPGLPHLHEPELRQLAAVTAALDLFVACDSGPMHLASASGAPTLGLFRVTRRHSYAPLGPVDLALDVSNLTPQQTARATLLQLEAALRYSRGSVHTADSAPL
ncbi:MAG TPA: glycosyltransferase family 9 protein [Nevskiales bacterium]|nr:glycosyltransferase family 9 protein [Nevskiales bacterium]